MDPTLRVARRELWRATGTPEGTGTVHVLIEDTDAIVESWGPGAGWLLERAASLLGTTDDDEGFVAQDPKMRDLQRRFPGMWIGRTDAVMEALVPAIVEQKVTSAEAHRSWAMMTNFWGEPAPGPMRLRVPVSSERLAHEQYWAYHRFGIERKRADTIRRAASVAARMEEIVDLPLDAAYRRLRSIQGVGAWTAAEVAVRALGDVDAVSVGDFHLPHLVSWVLAGEPKGSDERMLELLEPYRGQRARAIKLLETGARRPPRRAPRYAARSIATY
jgi:3-methyladenine DNA glycosylase/8-oxoguanine DNA glycosylase